MSQLPRCFACFFARFSSFLSGFTNARFPSHCSLHIRHSCCLLSSYGLIFLSFAFTISSAHIKILSGSEITMVNFTISRCRVLEILNIPARHGHIRLGYKPQNKANQTIELTSAMPSCFHVLGSKHSPASVPVTPGACSSSWR